MFIYSLRASTLKFFGVVALAVLTLAALIVFVPQYGETAATEAEAQTVDYTGMTSFPNRLPCVPDCAALRSCSSLPIYLPHAPPLSRREEVPTLSAIRSPSFRMTEIRQKI